MEAWEIKHEDFFLAKTNSDKVMFLLRYAILAPSTHNTQPWGFTADGNACEILLDKSKKLPIGDPKTRDLYISLGCCIENLISAGTAFGLKSSVDLKKLKAGIVKVEFSGFDKATTIVNETLLRAIIDRFNARGIFDEKSPNANFSKQIRDLSSTSVEVNVVEEKEKINEIAELTSRGLEMAYADPGFRAEISGWIRPNTSSKQDGIPGYALRVGTLMSILLPFLMRNFNIGKKLGMLNKTSLRSAPLVCVLATGKEEPGAWIEVGRISERIMLLFNANEMKTSVFVASIEMGDELAEELRKTVGTKLRPQFLFCGGYIDTPQGHTRRKRLEDLMIAGGQ